MASIYQNIQNFVSPFVKKYSRLEVKGLENLPSGTRGAILAPNHSGSLWWDALCLISAIPDREIRFVAHYWDASVAVIRKSLEMMDTYFLDQNLNTIDTHNAIVHGLKAGELLCQYPEESYHTIRDRYTLFRPAPQIIKYAHLAQVPVIPVAVIGVEEAAATLGGIKLRGVPLHIPLHVPLILPIKVTIEFGTPRTFEELTRTPKDSSSITESIYQQGADQLVEYMKFLIGNYRECKISEERYLERKSYF
ncbi:lysophospholipid acyltransferase family protein [Deltaproteobacteria bacterium TL4]